MGEERAALDGADKTGCYALHHYCRQCCLW